MRGRAYYTGCVSSSTSVMPRERSGGFSQSQLDPVPSGREPPPGRPDSLSRHTKLQADSSGRCKLGYQVPSGIYADDHESTPLGRPHGRRSMGDTHQVRP
jgi:hypothetical protein